MSRKRALVIYGEDEGIPAGPEVPSEASRPDAEAVASALRGEGYEARLLAVGRDLTAFLEGVNGFSPSVVFNLCEEVSGKSVHEVHVAGVLELLGVPYTGSDPAALSLSLDKARCNEVLSANEIPTPRHRVMDLPSGSTGGLRFPLIVKPLREDGSTAIGAASVVRSHRALRDRAGYVIDRFRQPALVEEFIEGREINVSILGNGAPEVLPLREIDFSKLPGSLPRICGYRAKWERESPEYRLTPPVCPARLPRRLLLRIKRAALEAYRVIGLRDYARVDIRLSREGTPFVIEVNPNPCISPDAGFMGSAAAAGLDFNRTIGRIVEACLGRASGPFGPAPADPSRVGRPAR